MAVKNKQQIVRFLTVGGLNTAIDFALLFLLKAAGLPVLGANIISTTVAFCFSFAANKKYTFQTTNTNLRREFVLFISFTLFGLWVLQTLVMQISLVSLESFGWPSDLDLLVAKILATAVTLIWNYLTYSRFVFAKRN